jgi:hypothetical protein
MVDQALIYSFQMEETNKSIFEGTHDKSDIAIINTDDAEVNTHCKDDVIILLAKDGTANAGAGADLVVCIEACSMNMGSLGDNKINQVDTGIGGRNGVNEYHVNSKGHTHFVGRSSSKDIYTIKIPLIANPGSSVKIENFSHRQDHINLELSKKENIHVVLNKEKFDSSQFTFQQEKQSDVNNVNIKNVLLYSHKEVPVIDDNGIELFKNIYTCLDLTNINADYKDANICIIGGTSPLELTLEDISCK